MKADVLVGLQWGDEGKGKFLEYFAKKYDVIARFQGGPVSGRCVPRGIAQNHDAILIIGSGCVIAPDRFMDDCKKIETFGINLKDRLLISKKAQIIMPTHRLLDEAYNEARGEKKVGTSGEGVGPALADKINRLGLRVGDINDHFAEKFATHKAMHESILRTMHVYASMDMNEIEAKWLEGVEYVKSFQFVDTDRQINKLLKNEKKVLCEGARGAMLDCDFGAYPFVSSCDTVSGAACTGLGISPTQIGEVYGVMKAYSTRQGTGPLTSELFDARAKVLQEKGQERDSGTDRERRCGWIDLVALKYAIMLNGVTKLILTKCDALDEFETIKACVAYKKDVEYIDYYPYAVNGTDIEPVFVEMPGWKQNITDMRTKDELPDELRQFIAFLEKELGMPISYLSVGPHREQTIEL